MKIKKFYLIIVLVIVSMCYSTAQNSSIRGSLLDAKTGNPIIYGDVYLEGTDIGTNTDEDGFFVFTNLDAGTYTVVAEYLGYSSTKEEVTVGSNSLKDLRLEIKPEGIKLNEIQISASESKAKKNVQVSAVSVSQTQIKSLPSTGGEADIAQYLPVLPGIIFSGDQGGQLYIRGGSPVQNKIMLDGMTIFNPFHSIGFFSVFETEAIKKADVLTGAFGAEYGNRVSAVVNIETRGGNKKRHSGLVSASPFQAKTLLEGPIIPLSDDSDASLTYLLTAKKGLLEYTGNTLYSYASVNEDDGLPFDYLDLYGKMSFFSGNGSEINLFGFNFTDNVRYSGVAALDWESAGGGIDMKIVPSLSNTIINGRFNFSNYNITLDQFDDKPRFNELTNYNLQIDFENFGLTSSFKYGLGFDAMRTDFSFISPAEISFQQQENAVELFSFFSYKQEIGGLILEPSIRATYYASLGEFAFEPRLGLKYNVTDDIRFKAAGGFYSQNIISTINEQDIVNLFVGFLLGPSGRIIDAETGQPTDSRLQKAYHGVAGFEFDLPYSLNLNVEGYYKRFSQLISINRNKLVASDPNYISETGNAYGIDFSLSFENENWYVWSTYSLGYVKRNDGEQIYPTIFDRRHNINILTTYSFGQNNSWEASARWNLGSGFPFTLTDGFYGYQPFNDNILNDYLTDNPELGIIYDEERNAGRLPTYHRLDVSLKKIFPISENTMFEVTASITNAYNRNNIFYFDRIDYERVDQLPVLPSLSGKFTF